MINAALLTLRLTAGGLLAGHGAQKLFGAFDGPGLAGTTGMLERLGVTPAEPWARVAGGSELAGGALTAAGLLSPLGPLTAAGPMVMAAGRVHAGKPIWVTKGGGEFPLTNLAIFTSLAMAGPGRFSLDRVLGIRLPRPVVALASAGAVAGIAAGLTAGRLWGRPAAQPEPEQPPVSVLGGGASAWQSAASQAEPAAEETQAVEDGEIVLPGERAQAAPARAESQP